MNKNKFVFVIDSFLNIFSTALPLLVLQLISMPIAASKLGTENFGIVITVISILTVIGFPIGNVLNNIRLLRNDEYHKKGLKGDFNYLLVGSSLISAILMVLFSILFIDDMNYFNIFLLVLIVIFSIFKEYLIVSYRISLNFKGILFNNIFLSVGYAFGTWLFVLSGLWEFIYLVGLLISLIYIIATTELFTESINKTSMFKTTFKEFIILYGSGLLKNFMSYADKIILLPLLGPKNVSIYYAASIIGKFASMLFTPINSVILSYIVKIDKINHKIFIKTLSVVSIVGVLGYFVTILISPYFLNFFYPLWADQSLELIYVTSAAAIIGVLSSVFHPFNLRYNNLKWQVLMSGTNLIFFFILAYFLTNWFGLIGFTISVLLSGIYILLFQMYIYFIVSDKRK